MESVFSVRGDIVEPTDRAQGPWDPRAMHGGALAALFAWHGERLPQTQGMHFARLSVDFLKPVPIQPLTLETRTVRDGGRLRIVETTASVEGETVARANGTWLRIAEVPLPDVAAGEDYLATVACPEELTPFDGRGLGKFTESMECRFAEGSYLAPGPASGWFRAPTRIVEGYENSPTMVAAAAADFGHGLSAIAPVNELLFVNPDLTITFARRPAGEWILLRSVTFPTTTGHGAAESEIYDRSGRVARSVQSLFFDLPRKASA